MFEKIILATDLSPAWDDLVDCAVEFRFLGCTRIILTHVITSTFFAGLTESLRAEVQAPLEQQKRRLAAQGFEVDTETPVGLPAYSLNDLTCRYGADLIVVGSHGKSLWREEVLGSFSSAVLHHTKYAVLLLKTRVDETKEQGSCRLEATEMLRHILFPTDFSAPAERALDYVAALGQKGSARVTLIHALDVPGGDVYPPGYQELAVSKDKDSLAGWRKRLQEAGLPKVEAIYNPGQAIPAILEVLKTHDISLVVLGTQGKGFIKEIFLGSVAHTVARLAPGPVLLIPISRE
jgi:nucleotide-binding universal stress UspA family protein